MSGVTQHLFTGYLTQAALNGTDVRLQGDRESGS